MDFRSSINGLMLIIINTHVAMSVPRLALLSRDSEGKLVTFDLEKELLQKTGFGISRMIQGRYLWHVIQTSI